MIKIKQIVFLLLAVLLFGCDAFTSPEDMKAPSNISLTKQDWNSIELTWEDNTSNETKYRIDRKIGEGDWEEKYKLLPKSSESFIDADLPEIGNYSYRVYARNSGGSSDFIEATYYLTFDVVTGIEMGDEYDSYLIVEKETEFEVNVLGTEGQLLDHDCLVWLKVISAPYGTSINNITNPADSVSVMSFNGMATLTIATGVLGGELIFYTYAYNPGGEKISAQLSSIVENKVAWIGFTWDHFIGLEPMQTAHIPAQIIDIFGNILMGEHEVFCQFLERPEGTNIDNRLFEVGETISLYSSEGTVIVPLNSGELSGDVGIKLFIIRDDGYESYDEINTVAVVASDPAYGELSYGEDNEGEDLGNGLWKINLDAFIGDEYQNPLPIGCSVEFTLPNNPDAVSIEDQFSFTGNNNSPDSGVAHNYLSYHSDSIGDIITVRIQCGNYIEEFEVSLPIQGRIL